MALGGTVIDVGDSAVDAILSGVGTLGVFATIRGINLANAKYAEHGDGEKAFFEGLEVAVEGTAKGVVDASEMVFKVAMSKPSRFIGRQLLKVAKKIDDKL